MRQRGMSFECDVIAISHILREALTARLTSMGILDSLFVKRVEDMTLTLFV